MANAIPIWRWNDCLLEDHGGSEYLDEILVAGCPLLALSYTVDCLEAYDQKGTEKGKPKPLNRIKLM
jgi:hypothetical protein